MSNHNKFNLTTAMKRKGLVLTINWSGGLSKVTTLKEQTRDGVERKNKKPFCTIQLVQKSVQSIHHLNAQTIQNWLANPASGYWKPNEWAKRSESARIQDHLEDFIHDMRSKGNILHWYVSE